MPIITGTASWASVLKPNTTFEPRWKIDLAISEEDRDRIVSECKVLSSELNPIFFKEDERGIIRVFDRKVENRVSGENNPSPKCVDSKNIPFTQNIGNGSRVNVLYSLYTWKNKFGEGIGTDLKGVQIIDLVPYEEEDFEVTEDGFQTEDFTNDAL